MKTIFSIDQKGAVELGLKLKEALVLGFIYEHHFDADHVNVDGVWWANIPKGYIIESLPILGIGKSALYKIMKDVEAKGLIELGGNPALGMTLVRFPDGGRQLADFR